ncbi:hypothetical protein PHISP_02591 [Aspergillus sp. HF37]|nr:hypothetical protein PHISP_02591 [Aspergillus sp. HF37]
MASRLARSALGAARLRPALPTRNLIPVAGSLTAVRANSNVPTQDPKQKAQSILDSVPGSSLVSKTATLSAAAGLSVAAISNELYVVNEETVVLFCVLCVFTGVAKYGGPMYREWAEGQVQRYKDILNSARTDHTDAVKQRIGNVQELSGVVDVTKQLFDVSRETAQLEAKAYELEQRTALASEVKHVLDSWVRYEGQVRQRQQRELAESVIGKIQKELENPKALQQILQQSVSDVERIVAAKPQ